MSMTLRELAERVGGEIVGDDSVVLSGVAGIREAKAGQLTFLSNPKYERYLSTTAASAVVVSGEHLRDAAKEGRSLLVSPHPYGAFAKAMELLADEQTAVERGVHSSAVVAETATLGFDVAVGANAAVLECASVGEGSTIHAGAYIGPGVTVGRDCVIHPNVTLEATCTLGDRVVIHAGSVVGSDGFGYATAEEGAGHLKVPQVGTVVIEDDVEIGSNVCIDRATIGSTRIGRGSKIDNLVQIGHNVVVGEDSIIVAQVGISGSTVIGNRVVLAGQAGIVGHIKIGDGAVVGAQSGVTKSIPEGETVSGYPARRHSLSKALAARLQELPALFRRVRALEKKISRFEEED
jgi:UDP-3-O-[3-hydroxymyristoyl] glucosamine N-acyltransferase